jgi:hypothetical protein
MRLNRVDAHDPGARDAADQALRNRGAAATVPAEVRRWRVDARVRTVRAGRRVRPGRHANQGPPGGIRMGDRRHQELDHQSRGGRLLHRVLRHRSRGGALTGHLRLRGGGRPARLLRRQARAQDGHSRIADGTADLRRRARAGGEPDRIRERGLQGGDVDPRPLAARRGGAGGRHRAGRDRLRGRVRERAPAVRKAHRLIPGDPVQAGGHGGAHGGGKGASV